MGLGYALDDDDEPGVVTSILVPKRKRDAGYVLVGLRSGLRS